MTCGKARVSLIHFYPWTPKKEKGSQQLASREENHQAVDLCGSHHISVDVQASKDFCRDLPLCIYFQLCLSLPAKNIISLGPSVQTAVSYWLLPVTHKELLLL